MKKIPYIHLLISINVMLTLSITSFAQGDRPTAVATEKGIWVYLGNEIPSDFQYRISKSVDGSDFVHVGTTTYRGEEGALKERTEEYYPLFENLDKPGDDELSYLRRYASASRTTDSVYIPNLPVMHLLLGTAFFDGEVTQGKTYTYSVARMEGRDRLREMTSNSAGYPAETGYPDRSSAAGRSSPRRWLYVGMSPEKAASAPSIYTAGYSERVTM